MGEPSSYLPPPIADETIVSLLESVGLPAPTSISRPKVTAQYHSIYILSFAYNVPGTDTSSLVLRVAGRHLPKIKTENESAVITWIARNLPSVPVPTVVRHDCTPNNPLGFEYELMVKAPGETLSDVYDSLSKEEKEGIVSQIVDILIQLRSHEWKHVGGLKFEGDEIVPGPVLEETFWQLPDVEKYWCDYASAVSVESLNIQGPYNGYVDYIAAHVERYIFAINTHESLSFLRDAVPRLEKFVAVIKSKEHKSELDNIRLVLAHKDLHFGNLMYDRSSQKITAVLDWEFAGVVPYTRWDPSRAFLWNGQMTEAAAKSQEEDQETFRKIAEEKGAGYLLEDAKYKFDLQEHMQLAQNFLRALVEVCPRGQRKELQEKWKATVLEHVAAFE